MGSYLLVDLSTVSTLPHHMWMVVLGTCAWIIGLVFAWLFYMKIEDSDPLSVRFPAFFEICRSKLFFDEIYRFYIDKIQDPAARFLEVMELLLVSGLMVRGAAGMTAVFSLLAKACYVGKIHAYVFWFLIGTLGFLIYSAGLFE